MLLFLQEDAHLFSEARVAEHSYLGCDVTPVSGGLQFLQPLSELSPHLNDPGGHRPDAVSPLLVQLRAGQDGVDYPGPVRGRVAVHGPDDERQLAPHPPHSPGIGAHNAQVAGSLVVETEVLAEALRAEQLEALGKST